MDSRGQGTIEYLVVLAIVVVISLIVVNFASDTFSDSSSNVRVNSGRIGSAIGTGGISVLDSIADSQGDAIINLTNITSDPVTITSITSGGRTSSYSHSVSGGGGSSRVFVDGNDSSCVCGAGDTVKLCDYTINYTTSSGLSKSITVTASVNCVSTVGGGSGIIGLGSGTLADPWVINSCAELQDMNRHLDGNYVLGADIDCSGTRSWNFLPAHCSDTGYASKTSCEAENYDWYGDDYSGFVPIGNGNNEQSNFVGSFNGLNKSISNLFINRVGNGYTALFGYVGSNSRIQNFSLVDVNVIGGIGSGGAVSSNYGTVSRVFVSGRVNAGDSHYAGGVVGYNHGIIAQSSFSGIVSTQGSEAGGVSGVNAGAISNCFSLGEVTDVAGNVGGIAGINEGTIRNSYSLMSLSDGDSRGGLVGYQDVGSVSYSFAAGNLFGSNGGLVFDVYSGSVSNSYWDANRTGASACCAFGSCSNCFKKNDSNTDWGAFFPVAALGGDYNVPIAHNSNSANDWNFNGVWVKVDGNYPVLQ